jgi:hypothetical protein
MTNWIQYDLWTIRLQRRGEASVVQDICEGEVNAATSVLNETARATSWRLHCGQEEEWDGDMRKKGHGQEEDNIHDEPMNTIKASVTRATGGAIVARTSV